MKNSKLVYSYGCTGLGRIDEPKCDISIYNARTSGEAKALHASRIKDAYKNVRYTDILVRKLGIPYTSEEFRKTAASRGLPGLICGDVVQVGDSKGVVVGHTATACFEVLFNTGAYEGQRLSVHPDEMHVLDERQGPVIEAWTDYPIIELGDAPGKTAPVRSCTILAYDRNKYCKVLVKGVQTSFKRCYLYGKPGRAGKVRQLAENKLNVLPLH